MLRVLTTLSSHSQTNDICATHDFAKLTKQESFWLRIAQPKALLQGAEFGKVAKV